MVGRNRWIGVFVVVVSLWLMMMSSVAAQEYPSLSEPPELDRDGSQDVAVIVAVEEYWDLPDIPGAVDAGNDWELFFQRSLGVETVHFLANRQATREEMERFARLAAQDVGEEGALWFVFIGHGAPAVRIDEHGAVAQDEADDGVFVGADARQDPHSLTSRGLSQNGLLEILNRGRQAQTVVVADACFSGRDASGEALVDAMPVIPMEATPQMDDRPTVILSAAQSREFAGPLPGVKRPAFSYLLLGALQGWAGGDEVTAAEAIEYTRRQLRGIPGRFTQTPALYGEEDIVLIRGVEGQDPQIRGLMRAFARDAAHEEMLDEIEPDEVECPEGKLASRDTVGNCCWPGQVWSMENERCIGIPSECPRGYIADIEGQSCELAPCEEGRVRVTGAHCCWEGQDWSQRQDRCIGLPASCPEGMVVDGEECVTAVAETLDPEVTHEERDIIDAPAMDDTESPTNPGKLYTFFGVGMLAIGGGLAGYGWTVARGIDEATMTQVEAEPELSRANSMVLGGALTGGVGLLSIGLGLVLWDSGGDSVEASGGVGGDGSFSVNVRTRW